MPNSCGYTYACTAVDTYSGYLLAIPAKVATQQSAIKLLDTIKLYYGTPRQIQSDNGSHFTGKLIQTYTKENYIKWPHRTNEWIA